MYGGVSISDQTYDLRKGVDIIVGTTGRIKDHIERGNLKFKNLKACILDEADQMLNMGFKEDVELIMNTVKKEIDHPIQTVMTSATIPSWVKKVAHDFLRPNYALIDLCKDL